MAAPKLLIGQSIKGILKSSGYMGPPWCAHGTRTPAGQQIHSRSRSRLFRCGIRRLFRAIASPRVELFLTSIPARAVWNISKTWPWFWNAIGIRSSNQPRGEESVWVIQRSRWPGISVSGERSSIGPEADVVRAFHGLDHNLADGL